jgi:heterogeneous nuclear ribonucleoprotein A1/A3
MRSSPPPTCLSGSTYEPVFKEIERVAGEDVASRKLFVHGLPFDLTGDRLQSVFSEFGEILEVHIVTDKQSGRSKGFGFVTFKRLEDARRALQQPSRKIDVSVCPCNHVTGA